MTLDDIRKLESGMVVHLVTIHGCVPYTLTTPVRDDDRGRPCCTAVHRDDKGRPVLVYHLNVSNAGNFHVADDCPRKPKAVRRRTKAAAKTG